MVETKPFKTKLCVLYQRGRCGRQTCTFAHGDTELRRFSGSSSDRRYYRGDDLRNKLDRRHSPLRRNSPVRYTRGWHGHQRFSPPRPLKRRKSGKHEHMDYQSDLSRSLEVSNGIGDRGKEKRLTPSDSRNTLEDELKQVKYEVDILLEKRGQLEIESKERIQEADSLSSRIRDLETQLSEEKEKSRRVNSKIKKLIRAHVWHSRLQDEFKRSQIQLEKLVEDLGSDAIQHFASEHNLNSNIISDEEVLELKHDCTSPVKKQMHSSIKDLEVPKSADTVKGNGISIEGFSQRSPCVRFNGDKDVELVYNGKDTAPLQSTVDKSKRRKGAVKGSTFSEKPKLLESNIVVPPTSMAAHAVDDFFELIDVDEKTEYEDEDKNVDVDGLQQNLDIV